MENKAGILFVFLNDTPMGRLTREAGGKLSFQYAGEYLGDPGSVPLSLSMPLEERKYGHETISPWLWGLLPDNELVLARWARRFQVSPSDCFGLLKGMGEDCAGAVRFISPENIDRVDSGGRELLDENEVARRLKELRTGAAIGRDPKDRGQFSLAGARSKTALQRRGNQWYLPWGREPTTHIFKLPHQDISGHIENEHFCLCLANELGLSVVRSEILHFGHETAIVVERFDRVTHQGRLIRVHQEDICQALGVHPVRKYQSDGGPDIPQMMSLLNRSGQPVVDRRRIVEAVAFNYLIMGTDAHAKNYSLLLGRNQQVRLARLYDTASFLPYVDRDKDCRFAMKIGGYYKDSQIQLRHFEKLARACEFPVEFMRRIVVEMTERMPAAADRVRKAMANKGIDHKIVNKLADLLIARASNKLKEFSESG